MTIGTRSVWGRRMWRHRTSDGKTITSTPKIWHTGSQDKDARELSNNKTLSYDFMGQSKVLPALLVAAAHLETLASQWMLVHGCSVTRA
jgi:hypothetical protein